MEYVQSVLFQVPAEKVEEMVRPGGLLAALEAHKARLGQMRGFLELLVVRSPNEEGPVQVVVETKWEDATSLVDYEESDFTVLHLLEPYADLVLPESLQVYDMEVLI